MKIKEALKILDEADVEYDYVNPRKTWRDWIEAYEEIHHTGLREYNSMVEDLADECDEDWRRHYSEPEQAIDLSYEDVCKMWGTPEEAG
jgi:hypothetical protein